MREPLVEHRVELAGFDTRALAYALYEGCGHCPQVEMPERLAASMVAFTCS